MMTKYLAAFLRGPGEKQPAMHGNVLVENVLLAVYSIYWLNFEMLLNILYRNFYSISSVLIKKRDTFSKLI